MNIPLLRMKNVKRHGFRLEVGVALSRCLGMDIVVCAMGMELSRLHLFGPGAMNDIGPRELGPICCHSLLLGREPRGKHRLATRRHFVDTPKDHRMVRLEE